MAAQALHKNCRQQTGGVWSVVNHHLQKYRFQFQTRSKRHQNSPVSGLASFHFNSTAKITPRMHQNAPFWAQKSKNFLGRGHPVGRGTPPPHTLPSRRLRRLDPRAYGARHSRLRRSSPQSPTEIAATAAQWPIVLKSVDTLLHCGSPGTVKLKLWKLLSVKSQMDRWTDGDMAYSLVKRRTTVWRQATSSCNASQSLRFLVFSIASLYCTSAKNI